MAVRDSLTALMWLLLTRLRWTASARPLHHWTSLAAGLILLTSGACRQTPVPPSVADGRRLYDGNGCVTCHGAAGHGDGRISASLSPPPRDLRAAFRSGTDETAIAETLAEGLPGDGGQMPRFLHLTEWERRSLARFVMSLRAAQVAAEAAARP